MAEFFAGVIITLGTVGLGIIVTVLYLTWRDQRGA